VRITHIGGPTALIELAAAPQEVRWLPIGEPVEL
jgi:hypothetical protein